MKKVLAVTGLTLAGLFIVAAALFVFLPNFHLNLDLNIGNNHLNLSNNDIERENKPNQPAATIDSVYETTNSFSYLASTQGQLSDTLRLQRDATEKAMAKMVRKIDLEKLAVKNGKFVHQVREQKEYTTDNQVICYSEITLYKK